MVIKTFSEMELKDLTLKNIFVILRYILLSVLSVLVYIILWHFIYKIGNEDAIVWGTIICLILGWKILKNYEYMVYTNLINRNSAGENIRVYRFKINTFLKLLLTPIAIPLMISAYICDFISDCIYKNDDTKEKDTNNKTTEEIKNSENNIKNKIDNYNPSTSFEFSDDDEEYYCEICMKKIPKEDYELYDCMCEDCFEEKRYYNKDKY